MSFEMAAVVKERHGHVEDSKSVAPERALTALIGLASAGEYTQHYEP